MPSVWCRRWHRVWLQEDLKARVRELTGGEGAHVIYDPVGGSCGTGAAIDRLGRALSGRLLPRARFRRFRGNLTLLKGCQIVGVFWGSFAMRDPEANQAHARRIFEMIAAGTLQPHIDVVLPFEQAADAAAFREPSR